MPLAPRSASAELPNNNDSPARAEPVTQLIMWIRSTSTVLFRRFRAPCFVACQLLMALLFVQLPAHLKAQQLRVELDAKMLVNEAEVGDPRGLIDEQREIIGPPQGQPTKSWQLNSKYWKQFPFSCYLDLGKEMNLSSLWLFDTNGTGDVAISVGAPGAWKEVATYDCGSYLKWAEIKLDVTSRYVRITRQTPGANFSEIAIYEYTKEAYEQLLAARAEQARLQAERAAALRRAREEALRRPLIELPPYGTLSLVDEIDCARPTPRTRFTSRRRTPAGCSPSWAATRAC